MDNNALFKELSSDEAAQIFGGRDWLEDAGHNTKVAINRIGDAIKDFITPTDPKMSETLMNCI